MPPGRSDRVHVVAGVLRDVRGRVLLARRTAGRDLAGAWEFPGGKVEPGESARDALARELHEELGIRIGAVEPFIAVPQAYPSKRIVLDVYTVTAFEGTPKGLEKQALAWAPPEMLSSYPMPPAATRSRAAGPASRRRRARGRASRRTPPSRSAPR